MNLDLILQFSLGLIFAAILLFVLDYITFRERLSKLESKYNELNFRYEQLDYIYKKLKKKGKY